MTADKNDFFDDDESFESKPSEIPDVSEVGFTTLTPVNEDVPVSDEEGISTIKAGEGAKFTTRENASEAAERARENARARYRKRHPDAAEPTEKSGHSWGSVLAVVVAAVLVLLLLFLVASCAMNSLEEDADDTEAESTDADSADTAEDADEDSGVDQEQVDVSGSISYGDYTYALATQDDGLYALVRTDAEGSSSTLFELEGIPVVLIRYGDIVVIPENTDSGWDVVCYSISSVGAVAGYVVDENGDVVGGSSEIVSAQLGDGVIRVADSNGQTTEVSLD